MNATEAAERKAEELGVDITSVEGTGQGGRITVGDVDEGRRGRRVAGGMPGTPAISPKRAARLKAKKYREAERLFLAEGTRFLEEAPAPPVQIFDEEAQILRVSTLKTPAGPVGVFPFLDVTVTELLRWYSASCCCTGFRTRGTSARPSAPRHAFGAGVALSRGSADLYNPKTVRASMGSIFHAPVAREVESATFLDAARRRGFRHGGGDARGGGDAEEHAGRGRS